MTLWVVLILMLVIALVVVLFPQLRKRRRAPRSRRDYDVAIYADQLREVKTDVERGVLSADQETQARLEIERRVLDADASQTILGKRSGSPLFSAVGASILLAFIPGFALGIYLWRGSPDVPSQFAEIPPVTAEAPGQAPEVGVTAEAGQAPEVGVAVEELVARLREQPENLDGWLLLGRSYIVLGRHSEAVRAYREAAGLAPGDATVQSRLGESMVMAAEGFVTPAAREVFAVALGVEPRDPAARYYLALAAAQDGDPQAAFDGWRALALDASADAPWLGDVRERLIGLAGELGLDADDALAGIPAGPATVQTAGRGPSQEDIEAAAEMTPAQRQAMIRGMVEGLAARLEENPNDPQGWLRLAQSYEVLGEQDDIAAAAELAPEDRLAMVRGMVEGLAARLADDPNDREGWLRLARSYEVLGEYRDALDTLGGAAQRFPNDVAILAEYARALIEEAGPGAAVPDTAVALYRRVLEADGGNPDALFITGLAEAQAGRAEEAVAVWRRLVAVLDPASPAHAEVNRRIEALEAGQ